MVMVMVVMAMEISKVGVGNVSIGGDGGVDSYGGDGGKDGTFCTMVLMLCCSFEEWYGSPIANLNSPPFSSRSLKMTIFQFRLNVLAFNLSRRISQQDDCFKKPFSSLIPKHLNLDLSMKSCRTCTMPSQNFRS